MFSLDRYLASKGSPEDNVVLENYSPEDAIVASQYYEADSPELTVFFPPWHGAREVTSKMIAKLARRGAVLAYDFHDHILEPDVDKVLASHEFISDTVAGDIEKRRANGGFERLHLLGMSLGNAALAMTTSKIDGNFTRATTVVPGSSLAHSLWNGVRTQGMRAAFEKEGISVEELNDAWKTLNPSHHAHLMGGKLVRAQLSTSDGFIPPAYGEQYVTDLETAGADVEVHRSRLGHAMNIISFCLRPPRDL